MPTCPSSSSLVSRSVKTKSIRSMQLKPRTILISLSVFMLSTAAVATADWLILADGQKVETRGPWRVDNGRVLYTSTSGALTALRLENVDLDASAKANLPPAKPRPTPPRKPAAVINQSDVATVSPAVRDGGATDPISASGTAEATTDSETAGETSSLSISEWRQVPFDSGTKLMGSVLNGDARSHIGARLEIFLRDETGEVLATAIASLGTRNLQTGDTTTFEATFPNVFSYRDVTFQLDSVPLRRNPRAEATNQSSNEPTSDESSIEEIQR